MCEMIHQVTYKNKTYNILLDENDYNDIKRLGYNIYLRIRPSGHYEVSLYKNGRSQSLKQFLFPNSDFVYSLSDPLDFRRSNLLPHRKQMHIVRKGTVCEVTINSIKYGNVTGLIDCDIADKIKSENINISVTKWSGSLYFILTNPTISLHRWIMQADDGQLIDHINQNTLDNRRSNLRFTDKSINALNSKVRKDNTSGFTGVYKSKNRWIARITWRGRTHQVGTFNTPEEANKARQEMLRKILNE